MRIAIAAAVACLSIIGVAATAQVHAAVRKHIEIPPEPLDLALRTLAKDRGFQVVYLTEDVRTLQTSGAVGDFTVDEALKKLLSDSRLEYKFVDDNTVSIFPKSSPTSALEDPPTQDSKGNEVPRNSQFRLAQTNPSGASSVENQDEESARQKEQKRSEQLQEVVVTGTSIPGVSSPVGSALTVYSREDIERSGAVTLDDFARVMTSNFSGVDSLSFNNSNIGQARLAYGDNRFAGASFDLHGVGPSSTLTLLNGQRLASAGFDGSITDISMIPLSAIDHIEVLDDGASSIYGADAIAGVVNIITRSNFSGAETGLKYGTAASGGDAQYSASQLFGHDWSSGNFLLDYEYEGKKGLDASQRDYIPDLGGANSLIPASHRNSVFGSGSWHVDSKTLLSGDVIYADRSYSSVTTEVSAPQDYYDKENYSGRVDQYGGTLKLDRELLSDWHAVVSTNYSRSNQRAYMLGFGEPNSTLSDYFNSTFADADTKEADLLFNGSLFALPAGSVKASFGAAYRREDFESQRMVTEPGFQSRTGANSIGRRVSSEFAEIFIPVVEPVNAVAGIHRLEVAASVRRDDYSDFGSTTNPKVGVTWDIVPGLAVRGSFGTSFRAPPLSDLGTVAGGETLSLPDTTSPTGVTDTLLIMGGNPDLKAETSRSLTAGFDVKPELVPNLTVSTTYFHIKFTNRITTAQLTELGILNDPAFAPFISRNPPMSLVEQYFNSPGWEGDYGGPGFTPAGPAAVEALFDSRFLNYASSITSGVDVSGSYTIPTRYGRFNVSTAISRLLDNEYQVSPAVPSFQLLNTYGEPNKWKARSALGWSIDEWTTSFDLNYVGSYKNNLFVPETSISSWTTADLQLSYKVSDGVPSEFFHGITIALSILNITNRQPPYASIPASLSGIPGVPTVPYDSANASPVGRYVSIQLTKHW